MQKRLLMLVATHKDFDDSHLPAEYQVVKVGTKECPIYSGWVKDSDGQDTISEKNPYYCELTAQYWQWKNGPTDVEYIGLCHYRRYFFSYKKKSKTFWDDIVSSSDVEKILKKHKVIMSIPSVKYPGAGRLYKHKDNSHEQHWLIMENIIRQYYPEYMKAFHKVLYGRYIVWGNMFIAQKELFDAYSQWLFEILNRFDEEMKARGLERVPREDGFLAEDLLMVYMYTYFKQREIYRLEVRNIETDGMAEYTGKSVKNTLVRFVRRHHSLLLFIRAARRTWLLWKRRS
jgi:hypothetical protein